MTLLFLDVDGPLIPYGISAPVSGTVQVQEGIHPLLDRLNPEHGAQLAALGCELVWATTWMQEANEVVGPRIGLPELPVLDWPDEQDDDRSGLHWKTRGVVAWADGRPFVWIDDEITAKDRAWVAVNHAGQALLHNVEPAVGLTGSDFTAIANWLAG